MSLRSLVYIEQRAGAIYYVAMTYEIIMRKRLTRGANKSEQMEESLSKK